MSYSAVDVFEERLILVTPSNRDADDARQVLTQAGICMTVVHDLVACCREMQCGVGAVIIAEEAMTTEDIPELFAYIEEQPTWSDVPIILLTGREAVTTDAARFLGLFDKSG
ncbi:MAG TPA: hypothetical protein VK530_00245, partial [Candidatus Acidoferrum sp.]|nr:hypothetical protein [Candidatus Acidoferrum sp.]